MCSLQLTGKAISYDFSWAYEWDENGTAGLQATDLRGVKSLFASCLSAVFNTSHV